MKLYFIFTKKGLAVILAVMILSLIVIGWFSTVNKAYADGSTHQKRMEFLAGYQIEVDENAIAVKETRLPQSTTGYFEKYNKTVLKGSSDLTDFLGKNITVYSYGLTTFPEKTVNLIICNGKIIAGDITDNLKGTVSPLVKEK